MILATTATVYSTGMSRLFQVSLLFHTLAVVLSATGSFFGNDLCYTYALTAWTDKFIVKMKTRGMVECKDDVACNGVWPVDHVSAIAWSTSNFPAS
jgi:hypothetical protein